MRRIACAVLALFLTAGCATTIDETRPGGAQATRPDSSKAPQSFRIPPKLADQLGRIETLTLGLGDAIVNGGSSTVRAELDALWKAARPTVQKDEQLEVVKMDDQFVLIDKAVEFKRPADADKAARLLIALFDDYLAKHPS